MNQLHFPLPPSQPRNTCPQAFKLDPAPSSLLQCIQAGHSVLQQQQQQQGPGTPSPPSQGVEQVTESALSSLTPAWGQLGEQLRLASLEGLPAHRQQLMHVACLHALAQHLGAGTAGGGGEGGEGGGCIPQCLEALELGRSTPFSMPLLAPGGAWPWGSRPGSGSRSGSPQAGSPVWGSSCRAHTLGALLLPRHLSSGPRSGSGSGSGFETNDVSLLLQLHRVARVIDALSSSSSPGVVAGGGAERLLLQALQAARTTSNFALCARMLPAVSSALTTSTAPTAPTASTASLECLVAVLQIEARGLDALPKALHRQLTALKPFLMTTQTQGQSVAGQERRRGIMEGGVAATIDLAHAFLAAGHWLSVKPQAATAAASAAGVDWRLVLSQLAQQGNIGSSVTQSGNSDSGGGSGSPRPLHCPLPPSRAPPALVAAHPAESACSLAALQLCPGLSAAWLQWGNQLYTWTKENRKAACSNFSSGTGQQAVHAVQSATGVWPNVVGGASSELLEGYAASAEALCTYLALAASTEAGQSREQHLPVLLRLLQVTLPWAD